MTTDPNEIGPLERAWLEHVEPHLPLDASDRMVEMMFMAFMTGAQHTLVLVMQASNHDSKLEFNTLTDEVSTWINRMTPTAGSC